MTALASAQMVVNWPVADTDRPSVADIGSAMPPIKKAPVPTTRLPRASTHKNHGRAAVATGAGGAVKAGWVKTTSVPSPG